MLMLQESSLDWALTHARRFSDTDVFPPAFEFEAIEYDWSTIKAWLCNQDILDWSVRPHRTLLAPKARYGFRVVTQLDPLDFLIFASIVKELASDIEARRVSIADQRVFSYRFKHDSSGQLFDPSTGYRDFLARCKEILEESSGVSYVAVTDIADFYPRIYHHRLQNALLASTAHSSHVKGLMKLLSGWNSSESYGIPVGNAPSRLLAEITISDVDDSLLANGVNFVRFNDDFRIFASSSAAAYRHLALLADILYKNHGLTLQQMKTEVLDRATFEQKYLTTPAEKAVNSLRERFAELLDELGIVDPYEPIFYEELTADQKSKIKSMNLAEILRDAVASPDEPDLTAIRFVLRRLGQIGDTSVLTDVLDGVDQLHPAFPDVIRYLMGLRDLTLEERQRVGSRILEILENSIISELEYHRMWALHLFASSSDWGNSDRFVSLLNSAHGESVRRELIMALGRSRKQHWFTSMRRNLFDESHWPRRALLAGASCTPADARRHWYHSIEPRLDPLELAVARWARQNPFSE